MGLAEQYKNALSHKFGSDVAVFDYAADFNEFWCEKNQLPASHIAKEAIDSKYKALIIVWDGMPDDGTPSLKLLAPHLTPLDWVLAFTIEMLSLGKEASVDFSIHIIDLTVKAYEDAHVSQVRGTLLDEMPWVNLYAPLVLPNARYRKRYISLDKLTGDDAIEELGLAVTMADSLHGRGDETFEVLKNVANLWRSSVVQSDDHHDLNNIAAPILMPIMMGFGEITSRRFAVIETAFLNRLLWCDLLDSKTVKFRPPQFSSPLDIVAIDDQLARGWDRVLGVLVGITTENVKAMPDSDQSLKVLGSNSSINLYGATDPNCLLKALGIIQDADTVKVDINLYKKRKFDSPVSNDSNSRPWMLVLDLHLFSGKVSEERQWYGTLARAAIQIAEWEKKEKVKEPVGKDELAWPGFNESEQIKHLANGGALDEAHTDTALSLFARLCALRWPSVPIIVFSATGRRGLVAKLAEYGNIFLSSQKPNVLTGNQGEQVAAFTESWNRELHSAMSLVQVQKSLLCLIERFSQDEFAKNKHNASTTICQYKHVVLAFDETGDFDSGESPAVGGVIALVDAVSREDALQKFAKFEEESRTLGLKFYDFAPVNWSSAPPSEIKDSSHSALQKGAKVSTMLVPLLQQSHNFKMGVFRLSITIPKRASLGWSDNEYMLALRACLELALCELPRSVGIQWGIESSLAIWLPSRQRPFVNEAQAIKESRQYDFRWEQKRSKYVESLGGYGAAYSIVVSAIGGRGNASEIIDSVTGIKTRTIPYTNIPQREGGAQSALFWYCPGCGQAVFPRSHSPQAIQRIKCNHGVYKGIEVETWPDYTVMLHLADAMLGLGDLPAEADCKAVMDKDISFDVVLDMRVRDFLHASRLFDQEQSPDAFKLGFKHGFFTEGLNKPGSFANAKIESGLVAQFWQHALQVKGNTLTELARIRTRGIGITAMGVAANQSHQRKNNHQPQKAPAQQVGGQATVKPSDQGKPLPQAKNIQVSIYGFTDNDNGACKSALTQALQMVNQGVIIYPFMNKFKKPRLGFEMPIENEQAVRDALNGIDEFKQGKWGFNIK